MSVVKNECCNQTQLLACDKQLHAQEYECGVFWQAHGPSRACDFLTLFFFFIALSVKIEIVWNHLKSSEAPTNVCL